MKTVEQATSRFAADLIDLIKANIRARMECAALVGKPASTSGYVQGNRALDETGSQSASDPANGLSLLLGYNAAIGKMGIVVPIECPDCGGSGEQRP